MVDRKLALTGRREEKDVIVHWPNLEGRGGNLIPVICTCIIGASLSEPHTSVTALRTRVSIWVALSSPGLKRLRHLIKYS